MTKYLDLSGLTYYHSKVKNLVGTVSGTTKTAAALSAVTYMESTGKAHDSLHADNADHAQSASTSSQADKITTPVNITVGNATKSFDGKTAVSFSAAEIGKMLSASTADQATKLTTARKITVGNKTLDFDGTKDILFTLDDIAATAKRVTWSELKNLRDTSGLTDGVNYRITDYACTTTQADTRSAEHQFDIIVVADDNHTLNENARAALHEGDTYFSNCKLSTWKLKYSLDNDTERFAWADSTNGKGVVYRMIDEWNNDCPYDFKNIQFKRYILDKTNLITTDHPNSIVETAIKTLFNASDNVVISVSSTIYYKGDYITNVYPNADADSLYVPYGDIVYDGDGPCLLCKIDQTKFDYFYTFSSHVSSSPTDKTMSSTTIHDNKLLIGGASGTHDSITEIGNGLPNTIFLNDSDCYGNTFGVNCYGNSFGNDCNYNTFGNDFQNNTFGNDCNYNTFGEGCNYNTFGEDCVSNSFGNNCDSNSFGSYFRNNTFRNNCKSNSFGDACRSNSFGNDCDSNTFGNSCTDSTFGNSCINSTFGNNFQNNTFRNNCKSNSFGNYCNSNSFGNNFQNNTFGDYCDSNTFGNYCNWNSFGNDCDSNTFGNNCNSNSFGNSCINSTFGNNFQNNTFRNNCKSNSFGNRCWFNSFGNDFQNNTFGNDFQNNTFGNYYQWNAFGNGCQYIKFDVTTGTSSYVQGIQVVNATQGTGSTYLVLKPTPNVKYSQWFGLNSSGELVTWIPADILPMTDAEVDTSIA